MASVQGRSRRGGAFGRRLARIDAAGLSMAYADPPYVGQGHRYPERSEVDQGALIGRLESEFPDGWALSLSVASLAEILPLAPAGARVGAWAKPFFGGKPHGQVQWAWEPVIWIGGRRRVANDWSAVDYLLANVTNRGAGRQAQVVLGEKPPAFARWIFRLLNLRPGDRFTDLFPGSGVMGRAWASWCDEPIQEGLLLG